MATHTSNREAWRFIAERKPFQGSNLRAEYTLGDYLVYSYSTLVAYIAETGETWITPEKYSQTTGRHKSHIRRGLEAYKDKHDTPEKVASL
jgi:hypothetical protein